jgi:predicted nuclease of predicted toxin-antitoxin system
MTIWIDAQLPPTIAAWVAETFGVVTRPVRDLGLREAKDREIFQAARAAAAVVMTKDADFVELVARLGSPPQILWVTCGNTTNERLRQILSKCLPLALPLLDRGEAVVEIKDAP